MYAMLGALDAAALLAAPGVHAQTAYRNHAGLLSPGVNKGIVVVRGYQPYKVAKFLLSGQITSPEGSTGDWLLFHGTSKSYSIHFDGHRCTGLYQPGRGLVDALGKVGASGKVEFQSVGQ